LARALIALADRQCRGLWLFTRALFDALAMRWWHALVWAAVADLSSSNCLWIAPAGL